MTDYRKEKVYAGVLGKIISVYSGRPFENWQYEKIEKTFGEINRYVNRQVNEPLVVADDDVTGTSMFLKSLEDHNFREDFSSRHVGQTWLDILIENKTVFWWGGYDMSTEHTAYLNLKNGIEAPASGSIEQNGPVVAEQIGAQIFIDYWGLINPDNPRGILFNYRGLLRNLEVRYEPDNGSMSLIRNHFDGEEVLGEASFTVERGRSYRIDLKVSATLYQVSIDGQQLFDVNVVNAKQLDRGCIGVSNYFGAIKLHSIHVEPML